MSERASQTAQRYVDAMNIASAKIEQLQAVTMERSVVHSKRTWPQWQPPV